MFNTNVWPPIALLPVMLLEVVLLALEPLLFRLWLKSCQGTGISLPDIADE